MPDDFEDSDVLPAAEQEIYDLGPSSDGHNSATGVRNHARRDGQADEASASASPMRDR